MKRDIKFRGKCRRGFDYSDGDRWVFGGLLKKGNECGIVKEEDVVLHIQTDDGVSNVCDFGVIPIESGSVGQFTGLKDSEGIEIYEDDIITEGYSDMADVWRERVWTVKWSNSYMAFMCYDKGSPCPRHLNKVACNTDVINVVGNIHDNKTEKKCEY